MGEFGLVGSLESDDFLFEVLAVVFESSDSIEEGLDGGLYFLIH